MLLEGGGVDGAPEEVCAVMSVAKLRKMLMSSRRIENDDMFGSGFKTKTNGRQVDSNDSDKGSSNNERKKRCTSIVGGP